MIRPFVVRPLVGGINALYNNSVTKTLSLEFWLPHTGCLWSLLLAKRLVDGWKSLLISSIPLQFPSVQHDSRPPLPSFPKYVGILGFGSFWGIVKYSYLERTSQVVELSAIKVTMSDVLTDGWIEKSVEVASRLKAQSSMKFRPRQRCCLESFKFNWIYTTTNDSKHLHKESTLFKSYNTKREREKNDL